MKYNSTWPLWHTVVNEEKNPATIILHGFIKLQSKLETFPYLLYSAISLIKSSMEILLLSCLNKGENRESLSTFP